VGPILPGAKLCGGLIIEAVSGAGASGGKLERALQVIALSLLGLAILWHGLAPIAGYDLWWQMATGREILEGGTMLRGDPFSHTYADHPWPYKDVGACLVFHVVHEGFGSAGLVVMKAIIYLATIGFLLDMLRRRKVPFALAVALASLAVASMAFRFSERPQIFSFLIAAAFIWVIDRYHRSRDGAGSASLFWTVPLALLNANLHRAGLLLPVIMGAYLMAILWYARRDSLPRASALRDAGLCLVGCTVACFLNPSGSAILSTSVAMIEDPLLHQAIPEWWSATPANLWAATPATALVLLVVAISLALRGRDQDPWDLLLIALALATGFRGVRFLPYIALLAIVPAASGWARKPEPWRGGRRHLIAIGACLAVLVGTLTGPLPAPSLSLERGRYPDAGVQFVRDEQPRGALYNDFGPGGYLIYQFAGGRADDRVYIDGRNDILYEPEFISEYVRSRSDEQVFDVIAEREDIQWLFLECRIDDGRRAFLDRSRTWALVHISENALIYVRRDGPNAELARRMEYRALHAHELSASIAAAGANPRRAEVATQEIERWLSEEPQGVKAHVAAAKLHVVLGPTHAEALERELSWLRARGMEI
jgi:hypothetical protein